MIRKGFYITSKQINFLENIDDLPVAEHVRRAIDEYITTLKNRLFSISPSKRGGDYDRSINQSGL